MASLPNAPNITIRPDAQDQALKFFWSAPIPNGSPPVLLYRLTDGGENTVSLPAFTTFYTYSGLTNGTSYTFRIAASNAIGLGPFAFYRTVQPGLTPGIPTLSTVISTTGSLNYTVGWSNPSNLGGATNLLGTLLTAFPLDASGNLITTSSLLVQTTVLGGNSNSFQQTLVPLTSNYNYKVLIQPVVDAGYGRDLLFTSTISSSFIPPPVYSPSSVQGMQLWLDANDSSSLLQVGSRVSQWSDKSGAGRIFSNATSNDSPTYDSVEKQLFFSSNALDATSILSTNQRNMNFFAVWSVSTTTGATFQAVFEQNALANSNGYRFMVYGSPFDSRTGNFYGLNGYGTNPTPTLGFPGFTVNSTMVSFIGAQSDGTTFTVNNRHNGALYSTQTISQANFNIASATTRLGRRVGGTEEPFYGKLAEILLYSTILSANQYVTLEGYLAWKWGLSTLLPSTHTFYTRKPEVTDSNLDFSPSSLGGTQVWLDAADTTTIIRSGTTSTMVSWNDKSGLGNNATAVNNPVYLPTDNSIVFNGSQHFILPNGAVPFSNSSYTYYFITQFSNINAGGVIGAGAATNNSSYNIRPDNGRIINYWFFNDIVTQNSFTINTRTAITSYYSTASIRALSLNYQSTVSDTPTARTQPNSNNTIGRTVANEFLSGRIHEILVFSTTHSQLERQRIEGYLAWKWGNQQFLPPTHLYSFRPPTRLDTYTDFSPSSITGLQLWTDASLFNVADNTSITMFSTMGTSYRGFQGAATVRSNALAGKSVVQILNAQSMSTTGATAITASNFAIFYIGRQFGTNNNKRVLQGDGNELYGYWDNKKNRWFSDNTWLVESSTPSDFNWDIWTFGRTSTNFTTMNWNGSNQYNATFTPSINGLGFNKGLFGNESSDSQIAEIMMFSTSLTPGDYARVEGYLAWKWGLQSYLPASHPFRFASTISLGPISS